MTIWVFIDHFPTSDTPIWLFIPDRRIGQPQEACGSTLREGMKLSHCHVDANWQKCYQCTMPDKVIKTKQSLDSVKIINVPFHDSTCAWTKKCSGFRQTWLCQSFPRLDQGHGKEGHHSAARLLGCRDMWIWGFPSMGGP